MSKDPLPLIEHAITRTRKNALTQLGMGVMWLVVLPLVSGGFQKLVIAFTVLNVIVAIYLVRRVVRLRRKGPAVRALLEAPADIQEIASWPRKLPPNRMPVFIDVHTRGGHTCSLLLDQKSPQFTLDLLGALQARSPEATLSIPKLTVSGS